MTSPLIAQYGIPAAAAVLSMLVGHWYGKRNASKTPATPAAVPTSPAAVLSHPAVMTFLVKLIQAAQASQHAALDGVVTKLFPTAAPAIPAINSVVDAVENKVISKQ